MKIKIDQNTDYPPAFVTYGWCRTAYSVVRSLGRKGIEVHVGDASSTAMSRHSRYCKSFTRLPDFFREPQAYFDRVCEALKKTGATVLLPCFEDVELMIKWRDKLPDGVKVAVPDYAMWDIAEDKLKYVDHVNNHGCPAPKTYAVSNREQLEEVLAKMSFPIVIKTRIGNSAKGVRIAYTHEEFYRDFFELVESHRLSSDRWPTIQEYLSGQKVGVLGIYNKGKHVNSIVFNIMRSKGASNFGTSTYRITIDDPVIKQQAISAMESLDWHGVVDMDWVRDSSGKAHLIDINGRVGGAAALTVFAGMDMPYLWYLITAGRDEIPSLTTYTDVKARWIIGDCLGFFDSIKQGKFSDAFQFIKPQRRCYHDDFCMDDPVPFFFEAVDYFKKFIKSGGSTNPITEGMIR